MTATCLSVISAARAWKPCRAVNQLTKKDEVKSTSVMFENCWLGGDPVMKTDTLVRMAAIKQLGAMFDRVVGTLKNV